MIRNRILTCLVLGLSLASVSVLMAGVGDPQARTDHPWYPGELACSTFERLAETQAALYERVVGRKPVSDEDRVLAAWLWRNTHFAHGEEGVEDLWNRGFENSTDSATRDYWTGLFAHGFGLCGTTHAQWTAEMQHLLGHNRARVVGVTGHNSFEVFLQGREYAAGRWALLDHDVSTVIFDDQGERLLSIADIKKDVRRYTKQNTAASKQHGWKVCGLHPDDGGGFDQFRTAEYLAGYAGPPPIVHLRRGETLRRYLKPGLEDGKTFVFWGRNYNTASIPGPERSRTWVNQPEKMYGSQTGAGYRAGQVRFANAVYTYRPNFQNGDYREGVIEETNEAVTFEFQSPYIIAATPPNQKPWGVYEAGGKNGLVVQAKSPVRVSLSTDRGQTWQEAGPVAHTLDLTDFAKGHRQYWIRFHATAKDLEDSNLTITTVCQTNVAVIPRLTDNGSRVEFLASGKALTSAGPNIAQAKAHLVSGSFDSPRVTLELKTPRKEPVVGVYAAAHVASSNPPSPKVSYQIEYSTDNEESWRPLVKDWRITRQGNEPKDFWSQSFCYGSEEENNLSSPIRVRFRNDGGKSYRRAELHLAYRIQKHDATRVTFCWQDDDGTHTASHEFPADNKADNKAPAVWNVPTGKSTQTRWVEYRPVH